jgi:hypothetical protein
MQAQFLDDDKHKNMKKIAHVSVNPLSKKLEVEVIAHPKIVAVTDFDKCMEDTTKAPPMFNDSTSTKLSKKFNTYTTIAEWVSGVM